MPTGIKQKTICFCVDRGLCAIMDHAHVTRISWKRNNFSFPLDNPDAVGGIALSTGHRVEYSYGCGRKRNRQDLLFWSRETRGADKGLQDVDNRGNGGVDGPETGERKGARLSFGHRAWIAVCIRPHKTSWCKFHDPITTVSIERENR
jgi:hypothetical protein